MWLFVPDLGNISVRMLFIIFKRMYMCVSSVPLSDIFSSWLVSSAGIEKSSVSSAHGVLWADVTGLCAGNSPVTGEFPAQRASDAENVFIWWRHNDMAIFRCQCSNPCMYPNVKVQKRMNKANAYVVLGNIYCLSFHKNLFQNNCRVTNDMLRAWLLWS